MSSGSDTGRRRSVPTTRNSSNGSVDTGTSGRTAGGSAVRPLAAADWGTAAADWGTASACVELGDATQCYDTEAGLLAAHPEVLGAVRGAGVSKTAVAAGGLTCSSSLRLYNGNSYTGTILYLNTRGVILNLSNYGFDNATSSYRVGACAAGFYSLANLGGTIYPGYTGAYAQYPSMIAGWNNVVSSVLIY